ncbi:MAG: DivIVA domain-containing protein, partial [Gemmatimonadetes bacterium]|nr:DivIVA domain-containing protein [Gemmatimonadota bacterium]
MIDLTPLDVRNKRGDFKKLMRGYDPQEVDVFLELVAERLEALVRENIQLRDRTAALQEQVEAQTGREQAVQDALVTA